MADEIRPILSEEELKEQIRNLLSNSIVDYSKVLDLSNELARFDNNRVRFTVDAGIISRLGEELVGKRETAVSELIKNAYDADATVVNAVFINAWTPGGTLLIDDDGLGMTKDQLVDGFMKLSSADKIHNPISPVYKRTRAGKKGIGRFAAQRLGRILTIITQTKEAQEALRVTIHWDQYEPDKPLSSIENSIETVPKERIQGTILIIENLRDSWSDAYVKRVYRSVSTLLQPFPLSKPLRAEDDPGFKSFFFREIKDESHKIVDEVSEITQFAVAVIDAYVDEDGQAHWSLKSDRFGYYHDFLIGQNEEDESSKMKYLRGIRARIYYFIFDSSLLSAQKRNEINSVVMEQGGIRLYRNGFRVFPYGEKGDDWLGLDESSRRRSVIAPHSNKNFMGLVEIDDVGALTLEETSSREGLIQDSAYEELVYYLSRVIIAAVLKVADLRGRKGSAGQTNWRKKNSSIRVDAALQELRSALEQFMGNEPTTNDDADPKSFYARAKELIESVFSARAEEKEERQNLIDENNMLRVLAGTGLVIGEFIHEIKRFVPEFYADLYVLKKELSDPDNLLKKIKEMEEGLVSFNSYTAYFDRTISRNVIRELEPINIKEQINKFYESILNDLDRSSIHMPQPVFVGKGLTTVPMHPSEWISILFNLYTNSKKALKETAEKKILIKCWKSDGMIIIDFSDNGKGIPDEDRENVFNAFFTTSLPVGQGDNTYSGTGLGLTIIRDIIESYNGKIEVVDPIMGYKTTFRITLPAKE